MNTISADWSNVNPTGSVEHDAHDHIMCFVVVPSAETGQLGGAGIGVTDTRSFSGMIVIVVEEGGEIELQLRESL